MLPAKIIRETDLFFRKDSRLLVFWGGASYGVFYVLADDTLVLSACTHSRDI